MESNYSQTLKFSFLNHTDTQQLFPKIDALLKAGVHISKEHFDHVDYFRFLQNESIFSSLKGYYMFFYNVILERHKDFYYLHFDKGSKSAIERETIAADVLLVAFLLFIMTSKGDYQIDSKEDFKNVLNEHYKDIEQSFCEALTANHITHQSKTDFEDSAFDDVLKRAFQKFNDLGWIYIFPDDDSKILPFKVLSALERVTLHYNTQINDIKNLQQTHNFKID